MSYPFGSYPFDAAGVDPFAHPVFITNAGRAPTINDIYPPGTEWMDNSVNPRQIYETTGAGVWYVSAGITTSLGSLTVTPGPVTITGTTGINTSGAGVTTIGTGGTGATNIGNATGNTTITGNANVTGKLNLTSAASFISVKGGTATDFIGRATLITGVATVANTNILATDRIFVTRSALNASPALGFPITTINAGVSFTISSFSATGVAVLTDVSTFDYFIVRQI